MEKVKRFLKEQKLRSSDIDMEKLVAIFMEEMIKGLEGNKSSLRMIPTYIEAENDFLTEVPVLAIDAGGTNFRAAMIRFSHSGKIEFDGIVNNRMPGLEKEISAKEFFRTLADNIRPLAERTDRIGFCFSYPTDILPNRDGRLIQFCKEVQAPEVVGQMIGENLLETLGTPEKHLVLLNDTVATLLAGKSASLNRTYDSYIGYILGTGTNTCYIEYNRNILKNKNLRQDRNQIINIESGNFGRAPRTDLDMTFDNSTMDPGNYTFEKMFSGGYLGGLCLTVLKAASAEGIFSRHSYEFLSGITELSSNVASSVFNNHGSEKNILRECFKHKEDMEYCKEIIDTLIDRAAKLVAANLAAVVLKTGKGSRPEKPVLITIEGTTFYKLHNLKVRFEKYFSEFLSGDRKRYVDFTEVEQSSLVGAALAGLIDL
jgi:hexokinase